MPNAAWGELARTERYRVIVEHVIVRLLIHAYFLPALAVIDGKRGRQPDARRDPLPGIALGAVNFAQDRCCRRAGLAPEPEAPFRIGQIHRGLFEADCPG